MLSLLFATNFHADAPNGGTALLPETLDIWQSVLDTVTIDPVEGESAVRIRATDSTVGAEAARAVAAIEEPIRKGDVLLLTISLRADPGEEMAIGFGPAHHVAAPRSIWNWIASTDEWHRVEVPFTADRSYAANEAAVTFWLGEAAGKCDIGTAQLLNYGESVEMHDLISSMCRGRIEVVVVDADGQPVPGLKVEMRQIRDAFGVPVDPQHPPYEGLASGDGAYGVPHTIAIKPLNGQHVDVDELPANARVFDLLPNAMRNPDRFPFSGIPTRLRGLKAVTIERGSHNAPGSSYAFAVDRPVEAYLFVQHLGEPDLGPGWQLTAMQATWGTTEWQVTDRVFVKRFNDGRIDVPAHFGQDEPWWTRVEGRTDEQGIFAAEGYKGFYHVHVNLGDEGRFTVNHLESKNKTIEFRLPRGSDILSMGLDSNGL